MPDRTAKVTLKPGCSVVEVDGADLAPVTSSLNISASGPHDLPRLVLDLVMPEIEVEGEMTVIVSDEVSAALVALGWTPPQAEAEPPQN